MYPNQNNFNYGQRNNQQGGQNQQPERKKRKVTFTPVPFVGEKSGKMLSSMDLSALVYDAFSIVFSDFEGCIILRDPYNNPQVMMYFKDKPAQEGKIKALQQFNASNTNSPNQAVNRFFAYNSRSQNKCYELTQDAKDILENYMLKRGNQKINWNQCIEEKWENAYNNSSIVVELKQLDIVRLVKAIYGSKKKVVDEDLKEREDRVDYSVSIIRPIVNGAYMPGPNVMDANFLLSIDQLDVREVENLARKLGAITQTSGSILMYRR